MKTKIALILIAVIAIILFSGCTQPKPQEEIIKIGALLPLSGANATYGIEIKNAIELAKEKINSAGGIGGKKLEIIFEDDQAEPAKGTVGMQKLVEIDKVPVVLGSWASGVVMATAPIAEKSKTVVMAIAISPAITNAGDYIFRIQPSAVAYTKKSVEFLKQQKISRAAVIFTNNEFGKSLKDSFEDDFEASNGEIVAIETYNQGDTDFRAQLSKIKSTNPEIVFIAGYQDTIEVIKQMKELGIEAKILAGPPFESQSTVEKLGPMAEGVIYAYHFIAGTGNPQAIGYEKAYLERYGKPTGGFAPLAYDSVFIIANAMQKCNQETGCIKEELYKTDYNGIVGKIIFDSNGDPIIPIVIKTVKNGKFVPYEGEQ